MKTHIILLITFSCLIMSIYAQEEKKTYWDNGNLKSLSNFNQEGQKSGYWEKYYESGEKKESGYYESDKKTGTWYEYYYNGTNKKRTSYYNGLIEDIKVYYDSGKLMISGRFDSNGKKTGRWMQYYDNWQLKLEGAFANGKKQGQWKYYLELGQLYKIENYNKGILISKWEGNTENTNHLVEDAADAVEVKVIEAIEAVETASNSFTNYGNRRNGQWKFYNENGRVIELGNYKSGRREGKWTTYYDNGQIKQEQLYNQGKLQEIISYFDKTGKALEKGTLNNGSGTVIEYDSNNKVINTTEYISGEKIDWNDWSQLNSLAWYIYEDETDLDALQRGLKLVKRSLQIEKNYYNMDTYAALLFKTGKYKQALSYARQAIVYAKRDKEDYSASTELIKQINEKMKK